jgi:L-asparaginase
MKPDQTAILLIYTGGTIGMVQDPKEGTMKPFDQKKIMHQIPELQSM